MNIEPRITKRVRYLFLHTSYFILLTSFFAPFTAAAQGQIKVFDTPNKGLNFTTFAGKLGNIGNAVIPFLIGVALVAIIWGIFTYIRSAGDSEKVAEGRKVIVYGIIGLFMMLSFWGFVMILTKTLFES